MHMKNSVITDLYIVFVNFLSSWSLIFIYPCLLLGFTKNPTLKALFYVLMLTYFVQTLLLMDMNC